MSLAFASRPNQIESILRNNQRRNIEYNENLSNQILSLFL